MASPKSGNNDLEQEIDTTTNENDSKWDPDRDSIVWQHLNSLLKWNWFLRENEKKDKKSVQNQN